MRPKIRVRWWSGQEPRGGGRSQGKELGEQSSWWGEQCMLRAGHGKELGDSKGKLSQFRAKGSREQGLPGLGTNLIHLPVHSHYLQETSRRDSVPPFSHLKNGNIECESCGVVPKIFLVS